MQVPATGQAVSIPSAQVGGVTYNTNLSVPMAQQINSTAPFERQNLLADFAPGVASAAMGIAQVKIKQQQEDQQAEANDALSQLIERSQDFLYNQEGSIYSRQGKNAMTAVTDTRQFYIDTTNQLAANLSPQSADVFRQQALRQRLQTQGSVAQFQNKQRQQWRLDSEKTVIEDLWNTALLNYESTDNYNMYQEEMSRRGYDMMVNMLGASPEEATVKTRNSVAKQNFQRGLKFAGDGKADLAFDVLVNGNLMSNDYEVLSKQIVTTDKEYQKKLMDSDATGYVLLDQDLQNKIDAISVGFESGTAGDLAIGYDPVGGTSYGAYQISSKTMPAFIDWLEGQGSPLDKSLAEQLRNSGPANTGSTNGSMPDVWTQLVASGQITRDIQYKFIKETHYDPAVKMLTPEAKSAVESDWVMQMQLWSASVQHGSKQAAQIVSQAYERSDGDINQFLLNVQEIRETKFPSQELSFQQAVAERLDKERQAYAALAKPRGLVEAGNVSLMDRPLLKNPDGSFSTMETMSFHDEDTGLEILVPTINNYGLRMTADEARQVYYDTGANLGKFKSADDAVAFAQKLSEIQGWRISEQFSIRQQQESEGTAGKPARISDLYTNIDREEINQYHQQALRRQRKAEIEQLTQSNFDSLSTQLKDIPYEEWDTAFYDLMDRLPPEEKRAMEAQWTQEKGYRKRRQDGVDGSLGHSFIRTRQQEGMGTGQIRALAMSSYQELRDMGMSSQGFENLIKSIDSMHGVTPENTAAAETLRADIAAGAFSNADQIRAQAYGKGLSQDQIEKDLVPFFESGGQDGIVFSNFNKFREQLAYYVPDAKQRKKYEDAGLYKAWSAVLPKGREPTKRDLQEAWQLLMDTPGEIGGGIIWDTDATLFEAFQSESSAHWYPQLNPVQNVVARDMFYQKYGRWPSNEEAAYIYKNEVMGIPGNRITTRGTQRITQFIDNYLVGEDINDPYARP